MQWHTHENLCYNAEGKVRGITNAAGECPPGLVKPVLASLKRDDDLAIADLAYLESISERTDGRLSTQHATTLAGIAELRPAPA